jgi:hypothetical protein
MHSLGHWPARNSGGRGNRRLQNGQPFLRWQRHHPHPEHGFVADIDVCVRLPDVRPRCAGWRANSAIGGADAWLINPDGLRRCIEGNVVQGTSRALSEEVAFDRAKVTSVDWTTYPILDITEAPEAIDIVLINRPELPPAGALEFSSSWQLRWPSGDFNSNRVLHDILGRATSRAN